MRTLVIDPLMLEPQVAAHAEEMFRLLRDPAIHITLVQPYPPAELPVEPGEILMHRALESA